MTALSDAHSSEVKSGARFEFGKNWSRFLKHLNETRIKLAEDSLREMLAVETLKDVRFLDVGSGSGLFSLAARRLGATVHSFDYDPRSVACTSELRRRYYPQDGNWTIEAGSALDDSYLQGLGQWDVVYSWGVLHHTGQMWKALSNIKSLVKLNGTLFIAIYNDLGEETDRWFAIKKKYNSFAPGLSLAYALTIIAQEERKSLFGYLENGGFKDWIRSWSQYDKQSARGMSKWHDWIDWIGGFPYERATVEEIVDFFGDDGFKLVKLKDQTSGYGCNEFVFSRLGEFGTHIPNMIPGGNSLVRQHGIRISQIEKVNGRWFGVLPALQNAGESLLLFNNDRFLRIVEDDRAAIELPHTDDEQLDPRNRYYIVLGEMRQITPSVSQTSGHTLTWHAPEFAHFSDHSAEPRRSRLYVLQDNIQLPVPHALHDDISRKGDGRFSHWGDNVYLSTLKNTRPSDHHFTIILPKV